jgi:hypothetical protein
MDITQPPNFLQKAASDQPFRIVESHVYAKIGGNDSLLPTPAVVHFGGYTLNEVHVQKISVLNTSDVSQRLHVVNTTTPFFRVRYEKKGRVAPGMSEDLYVEFKPNAWRYYYDCIRIHCEDENLLIPIHAYPVVNEVVFPKVLDFGASALCDITTRIIDVECKVPIQFEYEIIITKPHPDFNVTPLRGLIPANGKSQVVVTYSPVKLGTASMEMKIDVSQFNFEPIVCQVSGNAAPGIVRNRILAQINQANKATLQLKQQQQEEEVPESDDFAKTAINESLKKSRRAFAEGLPLETYDKVLEIPWHGIGSGAPMDAGGAYLAAKERTTYRTKKLKEDEMLLQHSSSNLHHDDYVNNQDVDIINGLRVPKDLTTMTAVNYLLTQEVGKLKPGDLKVAIEKQRAVRERRRLEQNLLKTGKVDDISADKIIADEVASLKAGQGKRQLKEMVFLQGLREISESEINREFQSQRQHIGSNLLDDKDIERIKMARKESKKAREHIARSEDRERYNTIAMAAHLEGERRGRAVTRSFTLSHPSHVPSYDVYQNDLWSMRRHALQKFQNAGNTIIIRLRCGGRLALIKRFLKQALGDVENMTRKQVRDLVDRDNRLAAAGVSLSRQLNEAAEANSTGEGSSEEGHAMPPLPLMDLPCMPTISSSGGGDTTMRDPVDVVIPTGFDHLQPSVLRLPKEAGLYNHVPIPLPPIRMYAPIETNRPLRTGAQEEESVRVKAKIPHQMIVNAVATKGEKSGGSGGAVVVPEEKEKKSTMSSEPDEESEKEDVKKKRKNVLLLPESASCWSEPVQISRAELLMPNPSVRPFFPENDVYTEADPEYYLMPTKIAFDAPNTRRRQLIHGIGTSTLGYTESVNTLSSIYQETLERPFKSSVHHLDHEAVWSQATVPSFLNGPDEEDIMSDTDSDEEEDVDVDVEIKWPTVEDSKIAFRGGNGEGPTGDNGPVSTADGSSKTGLRGNRRVVMLARDRTQMLLGKRRALSRLSREEAITNYLSEVDEAIIFPKYKMGF